MKTKSFIIISVLILAGCAAAPEGLPTTLPAVEDLPVSATVPPTLAPTPEPSPTPAPISFSLSSPAFGAGEMIPVQYARKGDDLSPPLEWGDPPDGTNSFALILYSDPVMDGGGNWVHWILYNIPLETRSLSEGIQPDQEGRNPDGSQHFKNSWGELGYGGPNPQHVQTFKYYFVLYALDAPLDLDAVEQRMEEDGTLPWIGSSLAVLEEAVAGHILGLGELTAAYKEVLD